jgi:23S rRNA (adenine2503-C2)-methyltransferase
VRQRLLPRAPAISPEALVAAGETYARASGHPVHYQWTLLAGVNDTDAEIAGAIRLLRGRYGRLNFILHNPADGEASAAPPLRRVIAMTRRLNQAGILTRIRRSAARDVAGGCGQLWARQNRADATDAHAHSGAKRPLSPSGGGAPALAIHRPANPVHS